jgi:hypothetical protein
VTETPGTTRKINNLEDVHCVRDAGIAGSDLFMPLLVRGLDDDTAENVVRDY